jgi:hypothetical protein
MKNKPRNIMLRSLDEMDAMVTALKVVTFNRIFGDRRKPLGDGWYVRQYADPNISNERKKCLSCSQITENLDKVVDTVTREIKLGAKCAIGSLLYFGVRAVLGADVHEVFNVDSPTNLFQTADMIAYTTPFLLPVLRTYLQSERNPYDINNIRDNPELGTRI